jgi:hypothetical protein
MKICLITDHSKASAPLAAVSMQNHWQYSARHGYDYLVMRREWADVLRAPLESVIRLIHNYDAIMLVGSDVLFTNFDTTIESILKPEDNWVLAVEPYTWPSYINLGVILMCNTYLSVKLMQDIDAAEPEWRNMRLISQDWLNIHYREYADTLRFVPTRVMNSPNHGIEKWQPGDFLCHWYGESNKAELMKEFLKGL